MHNDWTNSLFVIACVAARRRCIFFFFQAEDGIRDYKVTGVQTCALPILSKPSDQSLDVCGPSPGIVPLVNARPRPVGLVLFLAPRAAAVPPAGSGRPPLDRESVV